MLSHLIDHHTTRDSSPIPLTILTGFLGAGKTTLLNRILHDDHGLRVAVIVNDFGSVNIDAELVVGVKDNVISMANGCTCCTLRDDLVDTVQQTIAGPDRPEFIVLEASGIADPGGIIMAFTNPRLRDHIRVDCVTCVIDADAVFAHEDQPQIQDLKLRQIAFSDMVVLNKVSLAGSQRVAEVHDWIGRHFDNIRTYETDFCEIPGEVLLSLPNDPTAPGLVHSGADAPTTTGEPEFDTWTFRTDEPLSLARLREVAESLPGGVFRCKGIVACVEVPDRPVVLQGVARRVDLSTAAEWRENPETRIVVISSPGSVDPDFLQERFTWCVDALSPDRGA